MMCAATIADTVVQRQHRPSGGGPGDEPDQDFGDDAERAFGSDEEILERVAGHVLHALVAKPGNFAVRQDDLQAHDVVARDAVLQASQAAGILGDIAAIVLIRIEPGSGG